MADPTISANHILLKFVVKLDMCKCFLQMKINIFKISKYILYLHIPVWEYYRDLKITEFVNSVVWCEHVVFKKNTKSNTGCVKGPFLDKTGEHIIKFIFIQKSRQGPA